MLDGTVGVRHEGLGCHAAMVGAVQDTVSGLWKMAKIVHNTLQRTQNKLQGSTNPIYIKTS